MSIHINEKAADALYQFHVVEQPNVNLKRLQLDILQEECAELIQAISKMKRNIAEFSADVHQTQSYPSILKDVTEEMAHVLISINQVSKYLGIEQEAIDAEVQKKLDKYGIKIEES